MKKIKLLLILFISIFIFNIKVFAGANLSVSTNSVTKGGTFTVSVNMWGAAAWNIHVTASGPVSGCSINQADATADAMDTNKTFTATCTATGVGTINVSLSGDVTSASDGNAVMLGGSASVTVTEPTPQQPSNPTPAPSQPQNNLSTNNNLGTLKVDGYELVKVDNNNYTLTVNNSVTNISVSATAEDSSAAVTGVGKHELKVGENNIEIVVTSESGLHNKINIKVTRKEGYYLADLDTLLKDKSNNDVIISANSKITKDNLDKIKESGKEVNLNYYNEDKKLVYSWILDGSKIDETTEIITTITQESKEIKNISKLSNYADGMYINFEHSGKLPKGTKIKLYVGDKFEDESVVNIYHYEEKNNKMEGIKENIKVEDEYIQFDIEHCSEYFVTMSNLNVSNKKSSINIFMILSIIEFIIIVTLLIYFFKGKKTNNVGIKEDTALVTYENNTEVNQNINTDYLSYNENEFKYQEEIENQTNKNNFN